jgi:hypothetical protein
MGIFRVIEVRSCTKISRREIFRQMYSYQYLKLDLAVTLGASTVVSVFFVSNSTAQVHQWLQWE